MDTQMIDALYEELSRKLLPDIREVISQELSKRAPLPQCDKGNETDFFKALTQELMGKISSIYQEIHSLQAGSGEGMPNGEQVKEATCVVTDASQRLIQIIEQTEKATFDILDRVDRSMDTLDRIEELVGQHEDLSAKGTLDPLITTLKDDLLGITTDMSFQDLTGQRIKRVIEMLQRVEDMTADLYVSTGILLKTRERNPEQNLTQAKQAAQGAASQEEVDALMEQLNAAG